MNSRTNLESSTRISELNATKASHHTNDAHQLEGNAMGIRQKWPGMGN
jgi:hypothetical protein